MSEASAIENELNKIKNEASEFEKNVNNLRSERETLSEELHQLEIKSNEIKYKLNSLKETVQEEYAIDLQLKEFDDLDQFNFTESRNEVHDLKSKIIKNYKWNE